MVIVFWAICLAIMKLSKRDDMITPVEMEL